MNKNHSSIFQASDITSQSLYEYTKKEPQNIKDVVFFTKNDPGHGDIYLNNKLYTYFHDIDYSYNIIFDDKFTCRLTRDKENHALQLTYLSCSSPSLTFNVYKPDPTTTVPRTSSKYVIIELNNEVENLMFDDNEGNISYNDSEIDGIDIKHVDRNTIEETIIHPRNIPGIGIDPGDVTYDDLGLDLNTLLEGSTLANKHVFEITCSRQSAAQGQVTFTYIHNGQEYNYKLDINCVEVNAPCEDVVLYPKISYLYEGQIQEFSYYTTPKYTTNSIYTHNIPMSYNPRAITGYDVAYVKCGTYVAYSYVYMIEPVIEDIQLELYHTGIYLETNTTGKICTTIYPPEVLSYAKNRVNGSYNIHFYINDNYETPYTYIDSENNLIYSSFAFGNNISSINSYKFPSAGQYKISATLSYKGKTKTSYIFYPVGIEPKACTSIHAWENGLGEDVIPDIFSCSKYDASSVSTDTEMNILVNRFFPDADLTNQSVQNSIPRNVAAHFEHEDYLKNYNISPANVGNNGFTAHNFYEMAKIQVRDNIENDTLENLTFYANDGSHNSYTMPIKIKSNFITPIFTNMCAYLLDNNTRQLTSTICTNPKKQYEIVSYFTPNNATIFDNISYGETGITSYFDISNITTHSNYISFNCIANSYASDNNQVRFFTQNNKSSAYLDLTIKNDGSILEGVRAFKGTTYLGANSSNLDNKIYITYIPGSSTNISLNKFEYEIKNGNNANITFTRSNDVTINNTFYYSYAIHYGNTQYNSSDVTLILKPQLKQDLGNSEYKTVSANINVNIPMRSATISSNTSQIDKHNYSGSTAPVQLTVKSGLNLYNIAVLGIKNGNENYQYEPIIGGAETINITKNVDISQETTYTFAVFHEHSSGQYLRISPEISILVFTSIIEVNAIYDMEFMEDYYIVDQEIKLKIKVNGDVNTTNNIPLSLNSNNYTEIGREFGQIDTLGHREIIFTFKSKTNNINSLSVKESLSASSSLYSSSATVTVYPKVSSCEMKLQRNNIDVIDVYENGADPYNNVSVVLTCKNPSGTIVTNSNYKKQFNVNNSLGGVQNTNYIATTGKVGIQEITPIINGVEFSGATKSLNQYTLPTNLSLNINHIYGYDGFSEPITITPTFREGNDYISHKVSKLSYYYTDNYGNIIGNKYNLPELNNDETFITVTGKVGIGTKLITKCAYNNIQSVVDIQNKEITNISYQEDLYIKGNEEYFAQQININTTNMAGAVGSFGEQYSASSSLGDVLISFDPPAIYNSNIIIRNNFGKRIGENSFNVITNAESSRYINKDGNHSISFNQNIIPIKITGIEDITQNYTTGYANINTQYAGMFTNNNFTEFYYYVNGSQLTTEFSKVKVNNRYFTTSGNNNILSAYLFIHEYAPFSERTAYNSAIKYTNVTQYSDTNSLYVKKTNNDWGILSAGEYVGLGSYNTYMDILWYDTSIANILGTKTVPNVSNPIPYVGVVPIEYQYSYVIPLTYNMILRDQTIKNKLDNHLLSKFTICTGSGMNASSSTDHDQRFGSITIDLSNNSLTFGNSALANRLSNIILNITGGGISQDIIIWNKKTNSSMASSNISEIATTLKSMFKWRFNNYNSIEYTTNVVKLKYTKNNSNSDFIIGPTSITIKFNIGNVNVIHFNSGQMIYNNSGFYGVQNAITTMQQAGCENAHIFSPYSNYNWSAFDIYTTRSFNNVQCVETN